jgi:LPXTG-motif cell wall-anchored protein
VFDPDDLNRYEFGSKENVDAAYRQTSETNAGAYPILAISGVSLIIAGVFVTRRTRKRSL